MDKLSKDLDSMFSNYTEFLEKFDMNKSNITTVFFQWKMENEGGVKEFLWDIFEKVLYEAQEIENEITSYKVQLIIYKEMCKYKVEVNADNGNEYYKKYLYCGLRLYQLYEQQTVRIVAERCCPQCNKLNGLEISIADALLRQPLPSDKCKHEFCCNCLYLSMTKRR
jgi:hypothetical protein